MSNKALLELRGLTKKFGARTAVDSLDLSIRKGEIFGFLGPNGAGKSTTIRMILDVARPTSGSIRLFGMSNRRTPAAHRRIGYLSGDMVLDEDLTGRQYLDFVDSVYGGDRAERLNYRHHLAYELELEIDTKIARYSRGNRQKVGLVAAMMHNPDLLILDEPSSGFDPLIQEVFIKLVQEYRQDGGTVFISSHSLGEVQQLCNRVGFIREGKLAGVVAIDELNRTAIKQIRVAADKRVLGELARGAASLKGLTAQKIQPGTLNFTYSGGVRPLLVWLARYDLDDLTIREPELDEVFMTYYQRSTDQGSSE